ncbi:MAG: hypothetical protein ABIJ31_12195 [Pseudomonadota bacterium]
MKKPITLFLTLLIVIFSITLAHATQTATITLDGNKGDWSALTPAVVDPQGNSACGTTSDIKSVYTAMDSTHVYFMVETYGTPIENTNGGVSINVDYKPGQQLRWGDRDELVINIHSSGISFFLENDQDQDLDEITTIVGAQFSWGDVLEVSIPLDQLGNPSYFEASYVNMWNASLPAGDTNGCNAVQIQLPQGVDYGSIQKRYYEDGTTFNRLYFSMYDHTQSPPGDLMASATLFDPNGAVVNISGISYEPGNYLMGGYDGNTNQWNFDSGFNTFDNGYAVNFTDALVPGDYRLSVVTTGGWTDERKIRVSTPIQAPFISSTGFGKYLDSAGNLTLKSMSSQLPQLPQGFYASVKLYMAAESDPDNFFWISMNGFDRITIPKGTLDLLTAKGGKTKVQVFLRFHDDFGNNFQRNISNAVYLEDIPTKSQGIEYMYVQRRNYESGDTFNRLYFSMYDDNQSPPGDVLATASLFDPNGTQVVIPTPGYDPANLLTGRYDTNTSQFVLESGFNYFDNGYSANFSGDLIPGIYKLQVTTKDGSADERTFKVSSPVECPIISASSFRAFNDPSNNLIWEWDLPSPDSTLNTSINAYMSVEGDSNDFFWISVPTAINRLTIPKNTLDLLKAKGGKIIMRLLLRVNDDQGNNFQRNVSNAAYLDDVRISPPGDGNVMIESMYVQKRNYENGDTFNRLYFTLTDQNHNSVGDAMATAVLFDPNGTQVTVSGLAYEPANLLMGSYDVNNGKWKLASGFDYFDNGYAAKLGGDLVPGDYKLTVTTKGNETLERTFRASLPVECPIISASSFQAWKDTAGNLVWKWEPPFDINPALNTRISAAVSPDGDPTKFFWITVPTHFGSLSIPKTTLDLLNVSDDKIRLRLFLRVNDEYGNNFQRNASNSVSLKDAMVTPLNGDVNKDGKIGIFEAINALKVISGASSE